MGDEVNDRRTVAVPSQLRDVMIVPNARVPLPTGEDTFDLLQQNWIFGQQWKQADAGHRATIELRIGGTEADFLDAVRRAAATARGRDVILAVGHGGAGGFRGLTQTAFDAVPNANNALTNHPLAITREVLDLPEVAEKKDGKWVSKRVAESPDVVSILSQERVDALAARFDMLVKAGELLRSAGVARFVVLTCNLAKDVPAPGKKTFHELLAALLGVDVLVFGGLIAIGEVVFEGPGQPKRMREQIWVALDEGNPSKGRPPSNNPDDDSFHELPQSARLLACAPARTP